MPLPVPPGCRTSDRRCSATAAIAHSVPRSRLPAPPDCDPERREPPACRRWARPTMPWPRPPRSPGRRCPPRLPAGRCLPMPKPVHSWLIAMPSIKPQAPRSHRLQPTRSHPNRRTSMRHCGASPAAPRSDSPWTRSRMSSTQLSWSIRLCPLRLTPVSRRSPRRHRGPRQARPRVRRSDSRWRCSTTGGVQRHHWSELLKFGWDFIAQARSFFPQLWLSRFSAFVTLPVGPGHAIDAHSAMPGCFQGVLAPGNKPRVYWPLEVCPFMHVYSCWAARQVAGRPARTRF